MDNYRDQLKKEILKSIESLEIVIKKQKEKYKDILKKEEKDVNSNNQR